MATISAVRDALKSTLEAAVSGLRVHDTIPGDVYPPCAVVLPESGLPNTIGRGLDTFQYRLRLVVSVASERAGQDSLDAYLSSSGSSSIRAALHATPGLGLAGTHARWAGWENYGDIQWNETVYLGADVLIVVETRGDS